MPTMADVFAKEGYATGIFGKWHLGDSYPHRPIDKGFQESVYHLGWGQLHSTPEFDWPLIDGRYFHNGKEQRYQGHCTDLWFDSAMVWMKECRRKNQPFFCYLPTNAPHAPHIDLEKYLKLYRGQGPAAFFAMIAHLDARFGDLQRFLIDEKLRDDTIVVFMTDNGGTAGVSTFNAGLRAGKTTYYDGGHRVPCWIRWPSGALGEPRDIKIPTQNTDLLPTLCELCGVAQPKQDAADDLYRGISLAPILLGQEQKLPDRQFVVQYGQTPKKFEACVVWGPWRLVKGEELYDIEADRSQKNDLAASHADVVKSMRGYYERWWSGLEHQLNEFVTISIRQTATVVELTSVTEGIYTAATSGKRAPKGGTGTSVEEAGDYVFTRRWPSNEAALGDKYEASTRRPTSRTSRLSASRPPRRSTSLA
jgi:arylsulfatase